MIKAKMETEKERKEKHNIQIIQKKPLNIFC